MLDIKWIRENPAEFDKAMVSRGSKPVSAEILALDQDKRDLAGIFFNGKLFLYWCYEITNSITMFFKETFHASLSVR